MLGSSRYTGLDGDKPFRNPVQGHKVRDRVVQPQNVLRLPMSERAIPKGKIIVRLGPRSDDGHRFAIIYETLDDKGTCMAKVGFLIEEQAKPPTNS